MDIKRMYESLVTLRKGGMKATSKTQYDDDIDILDKIEVTEIDTMIQNLKSLARDRATRYQDYEEMLNDAIIGGAVELIADECSQVSDVMDMSYWVESDDNTFEGEANMWLKEIFKVNTQAYNIAMQFVVYGDFFARTFQNSEDAGKKYFTVGDYFEITNPRYVQDVQFYGTTKGYNYVDPNDASNVTLFKEDEFIHVCNNKSLFKEYVEVEFMNEQTQQRDILVCTVQSGKSFLESSRQAFKILDLLDSMVLSSRVAMSQILRIFSLEVKTSDKKTTRKMINEFKSSLQNQTLKKDEEFRVGKKVGSISNIVIPSREGKGDVNVTTEGGDVDIKSLADLDYYTNKLMASLRVPKAFLGLDETQALIGSNGSLTRQDVRYARMIKAVKSLICEALKEILIFSWGKRGKKTPDFRIMSEAVSTIEEMEKQEAISLGIGTATQVKDMLSEIEIVDQEKLLTYLIEEIIKLPKADKFLKQEYLDKVQKEAEEKRKQQQEALRKSLIAGKKKNKKA